MIISLIGILIIVAIMGLFGVTAALYYHAQLRHGLFQADNKTEFKSDFRKQMEEGKPSYYYIRQLERELYGYTFTTITGEVDNTTEVEIYYATHEQRPMSDPQPIPKDKWSDWEA